MKEEKCFIYLGDTPGEDHPGFICCCYYFCLFQWAKYFAFLTVSYNVHVEKEQDDSFVSVILSVKEKNIYYILNYINSISTLNQILGIWQ